MKILIDSQKSIEVSAIALADEHGDAHTIVSLSDTYAVLTAWKDLDIACRNFRYGRDESDSEPGMIVIAWVDATGCLHMADVDPFWTGSSTLNAYSLDELAGAVGIDSLQWGASIGEPAP